MKKIFIIFLSVATAMITPELRGVNNNDTYICDGNSVSATIVMREVLEHPSVACLRQKTLEVVPEDKKPEFEAMWADVQRGEKVLIFGCDDKEDVQCVVECKSPVQEENFWRCNMAIFYRSYSFCDGKLDILLSEGGARVILFFQRSVGNI